MPLPAKTALRQWRRLLAALACVLAACQQDSQTPELDTALCMAEVVPIPEIQGDGFQSPQTGREVTVRGIVTQIVNDGFYLESQTPDASSATSEGLFVQAKPVPAETSHGLLLAVRGTVTELGEDRNTLTALAGLAGTRVCQRNVALPLTTRRLPMSDLQREASEGMRIEFEQALAVTDVYRLSQGKISISADHLLPAPTEIARPGNDAREQDRLNRQSALYVQLPSVPTVPFPASSGMARLQGVLGHDGRRLELLLQEELNLVPPVLPTVQDSAGGDLRIMNLNLHNYFNGDGAGDGFRANRGAANAAAFAAQRQRLVAALRWVQPHITAVVELENDGFGPDSAAADFTRDLEKATGHSWLAVDPGTDLIGPDLIRVGLFYRPDRVQALGVAAVLEGPAFHHLSRPPLGQVFTHRNSPEPFLVVVNHLKSKGSCPDSGRDANNKDGQSCWNQARVVAADAMASWARELAAGRAGGRALLLGDINAYRLENPIRVILDAGFEDLTAPAGLGFEYSYSYYGRSGTLDHAFATAPLRRNVRSAQILHVNAGYPPNLPLAHEWLRFSDHDPVVVDLRLSQSSTQP